MFNIWVSEACACASICKIAGIIYVENNRDSEQKLIILPSMKKTLPGCSTSCHSVCMSSHFTRNSRFIQKLALMCRKKCGEKKSDFWVSYWIRRLQYVIFTSLHHRIWYHVVISTFQIDLTGLAFRSCFRVTKFKHSQFLLNLRVRVSGRNL